MNPVEPQAPRPRRKQAPAPRAHGWSRASDPGTAGAGGSSRRGKAPAGTSLLLGLIVAVLGAIGIVRVRASTRVLQLGAEITKLTGEQARLLEEKRRLGAERAYLRHPDQIVEVARDRLGLVPVAPELVQKIRLIEEGDTP